MRAPVPSGPSSYFHNSPIKIESLRRKANESFELIRANFRELLSNEKLAACGSRNGPSEIPTPTHAAGWKNLAWPKLENSTVVERVGSKTKIFNVRVFPILHSSRAIPLLNGKRLSEAFSKYVIKDPEVIALGARAMARGGYREVFEDGNAPGPVTDYHWSLTQSADQRAFDFVRQLAWITLDDIPKPSAEINAAVVALTDRCHALQRLLAGGQITAEGTFVQTGLISAIHRTQWQRSGVTVDVQNGDLCEGEGRQRTVRWSGIVLEAPHHSQLLPLDNPGLDSTPPPLSDKVDIVAKTTATRESVKEAIAALWPDGIPLSMELQQRDERIIAWQRLKQSKVASPKSIRRYLSRDGRLR